MKLQLKRSNVLTSGAAKVPTASQLEYGELAINYNNSDPAIFLKDSNNNVIRISGVGNIADDGQVELPASTTPPANPEAGNLWFNSDEGRLYIYYVDANTSQWVDASPDSYDPSVVPDMSNPDYQAGTLDDRYNSSQVGTTAPAVTTRQEGALWWNSAANEGKLYVLYNDPAPDGRKKWVEASPYPDTSSYVVKVDNGTQQNITGGGGLTIDGNVGIGTTTPGSYNASADNLVVQNNGGTGAAGITIRAGTGSQSTIYFADGTGASDAIRGYVQYFHNGDFLRFGTNANERVRIDSSGNILAGLTSAVGISGTPADLNSTEIGRGYINISRDDTSAADHIQFGKNGSVASSIGTSTTNSLTFKTGTTERMRLDSSGRLLLNGGSDVRMELGTNGTTGSNDRNHIRADGDNLKYNTCDTGNHIFEINGSEKVRYDSSGNVTIGPYMTSPYVKGMRLFPDNSGRSAIVMNGTGTDHMALGVYDGNSSSYKLTLKHNGDITGNEFNNSSSGKGLYNVANNTHWMSTSTSEWTARSNTTSTKIKLQTTGSQTRGYLYCDNANNFGLLDYAGNWILKAPSGTRNVELPAGDFTASGNITAYSDITLKDNIETIPDALDKVSQIRGVTFDRNDLEDAPRQTGVIAQEVEKVLPEVVSENEDGLKTVAYGNIVGLLIESIKELKIEIEALKMERN